MMSNNTVCPNFYPPVVDTVDTYAVDGTPGAVGTATSVTVPLGRLVASGYTIMQCNGLEGSQVVYFMANCQTFVPPPDICFVDCYGGGGDCYPYCGGGDGCSYCSENWIWDAQCHDASDPVCVL